MFWLAIRSLLAIYVESFWPPRFFSFVACQFFDIWLFQFTRKVIWGQSKSNFIPPRSSRGQFGDLKVNISNDFLIFVINSLLLVILFLNVSNKLWPFECTQGIVSHSENNLRHRCFWDCCLALPSPWNPPYPNWTVPLPKIHQNSPFGRNQQFQNPWKIT